ncbi:RrF2 family transcriptional regulator [Neogemmobacter tilapiae]|uniref:HTH-type transcriptional repressor NsrR n=1 Tax=Neogemmobacter tilapiae TaxID=875041 RepID=A0A918TIC4_9RHOB|nr:Rrf2 family transcriptional regulator [Gemmobacter tilapiae]GHC47145.1 HTH-type transcriptional repressor NsrR [Gemmobacter tilapiae]
MRLTSFTDYGMRILMRMAAEPERGHSTTELAEEFGLSRHHLAKIVQKLAQGGILQTRRGGGGGAMLARPADQVTLAQIVCLLEEGQPLVECFAKGGNLCRIDGHCRLKTRLRHAENAFLTALDKSTLADVALTPIG